eukprot:COSAG05_NODE_4721_length_1398_cov_26.780600_2_plen_366_part_01
MNLISTLTWEEAVGDSVVPPYAHFNLSTEANERFLNAECEGDACRELSYILLGLGVSENNLSPTLTQLRGTANVSGGELDQTDTQSSLNLISTLTWEEAVGDSVVPPYAHFNLSTEANERFLNAECEGDACHELSYTIAGVALSHVAQELGVNASLNVFSAAEVHLHENMSIYSPWTRATMVDSNGTMPEQPYCHLDGPLMNVHVKNLTFDIAGLDGDVEDVRLTMAMQPEITSVRRSLEAIQGSSDDQLFGNIEMIQLSMGSTDMLDMGSVECTCAANRFDQNDDGADGCEKGCLVLSHALCISCSAADTCNTYSCNANWFDVDAHPSNNCEIGCPDVPGGVCGSCSSPDTCTAVTCSLNWFDVD